ncbi:MAG: hypothetical protein EAX87_12120 [Candidatus Thorarchaeota archaeon]|nr:hypothetical protein [Candidatus Thorarchaeota archaeon]
MGLVMIIGNPSPNPFDLKARLLHIITNEKISSLNMISSLTETDESQIRSILEELVDEGTLEGAFTEDGQRFFLSDIKVSSAPLAPNQDEGYSVKKVDTKLGKVVFMSGLVMMGAGYIARGLTTISTVMDSVGSAAVMIGFVVLIGGWLMITRADPPSNLR